MAPPSEVKKNTHTQKKTKTESKINRWTTTDQPENDCGFLMSHWLRVHNVRGVAILAQNPLKLAQTLRVISDVEVTLRNFCFEWLSEQWCISQFFTFAWQPTANRLPNSVSGRKLSENWQETQIGGCTVIHFLLSLPLEVLEVPYDINMRQKRHILTFWLLPFREYYTSLTKQANVHSASSHNSSVPWTHSAFLNEA